jgi:hypothetical protein
MARANFAEGEKKRIFDTVSRPSGVRENVVQRPVAQLYASFCTTQCVERYLALLGFAISTSTSRTAKRVPWHQKQRSRSLQILCRPSGKPTMNVHQIV